MAVAPGKYRGFMDALEKARLREHARKDNNYEEADRLRAELNADGVRLDDKRHVLITSSGLEGSFSLQHDMTIEEISFICFDREEARKENNYKEADRIRSYITSFGIILNDTTHTFKTADGQTGSYDLRQAERNDQNRPQRAAVPLRPVAAGRPTSVPRSSQVPGRIPDFHDFPDAERVALEAELADARRTYHEARDRMMDLERRLDRLTARPPPPPPTGGAELRFTGYLDVLNLALQREELRKNKDYSGADEIRKILSARGVQVDDASHTFFMQGLTGGYDLSKNVTPTEIQYVALEREEARRDRNYAQGDTLRQWLTERGVILDDKMHTFRLKDGTIGSFDLRSWKPVEANFEGEAKRRRL